MFICSKVGPKPVDRISTSTGLMNTSRIWIVALIAWSSLVQPARAQVSSVNVVGYVYQFIFPGDNLIGSPLSYSNNTLGQVFSGVPDDSTFSPWNAAIKQYLPASTYHSDTGWSIDYSFVPGDGALFHAAGGFTNLYVGGTTPDPPTPPARGAGLYLLSSPWPADGRTFQDIIGRNPLEGEYVTELNALTQDYITTTFLNGTWNNGAPTLDIGQAAFFYLVPEPTVSTLGFSGVILVLLRRRRGRRQPRHGSM
jgi:hypothetical protein